MRSVHMRRYIVEEGVASVSVSSSALLRWMRLENHAGGLSVRKSWVGRLNVTGDR
jgi:hypothetical protein